MADDWDLHAVVRGCCSSSSAVTSSSPTTVVEKQSNNHPVLFGDLYYTPPFRQQESSTFYCLNYHPPEEEEESRKRVNQNQKRPLSFSASSSSVTSKATGTSNTSRSKRRKIQHKKVCHVAAEALNSDVWAWRKYGQKPIKGSPYPRGYYRCSTSKGCLARKQVERNRSDPTMFIVTYTAEHNHQAPTHRNSLAGSTRQKTSDQPSTTATYSSSPVTSTDEFALPVAGDEDLSDFFQGLEEFAAGDSSSGNSAPATTTGGM